MILKTDLDKPETASLRTGFPLSFAQQRLWFVDQLEPGSPLYNIPIVLDCDGPLDASVLERSLTELCRRHECLRTSFPSVDGEPRQCVGPPAPVRLEIEDLSAVQSGSQGEQANVRIDALVIEPFDLSRGPLFRLRVLRLSPTRHVVVGAIHHIVSDKWSSEIFLGELGILYAAFLEGRPSPLEPLPTTYADCAKREREGLKGDVLERKLGYWRESLAEPRSELELPTDLPRPLLASYKGGHESTTLSTDIVGKLEQLCRGERATLYMALLAAYGVLLHRYTGEVDLIVGSPVANRPTRDTEGLIGFFVNTLALRLDLSGAPTFRKCLERVKNVAVGAYEHQSFPFEKLIEELSPERSLSRTPIFQTVLNFHNVPSSTQNGVTAGPLRIRRRQVATPTAKFDLTLTLRRDEDGLDVSAEYATELFEARTIRRLLGHYKQLLTSAAADPDQSVSTLRMLTTSEETRLLASVGGTKKAIPTDPIHVLIQRQANRTPDAVAVETSDGRMTFAELDDQSSRFAHFLMSRGAKGGDLVGICLPRTRQMVTAVLGILKAGAAYVPLDPAFPRQRLEFMARDADLTLVVSHSEVAGRVEECGVPVVHLDAEDVALQGQKATPVGNDTTTGDLAYVSYTSGSTGKPKGVRVTHACVANFLESMRERPGLTQGDVMLAVTTLSFDISVLELFLPLLVGARVYVVDPHTAADGKKLAMAIASSDATVMQATPATWQMLFDAGWEGGSDLRALCGGEALPRPLAQRLVGCVSELWNMYGPTETTVWSTCGEVTDPEGQVTVGRPIANTTVYVLDDYLQILPVGVEGEIYIGGSGVAAGYLGRRELTAERFVPNPFRGDPSQRLYRTGDVGRWRADGQLELFGRVDRQVKVRGFRIEPGEIETALLKHPAVKGCVVEPKRAVGDDVRLVAYLVYQDYEELTVSEVRQFLRKCLPDYMVPGLVMELESLPLTPNGKVDRRALPDPFESRDRRPDQGPLSSPSERLVAGVWQELLGVDHVGREDNFFELGGHSLLSIRAVSALEKETGHRIDPRMMFFQTLSQIAAGLAEPRQA